MSFRFRINALALAVALFAGSASAAEPFNICAEPDSLPLSRESDRSGLELDVAQILADEMGRPLEVRWVAQRDYAYFRQTLGTGACDAIMSVPAGFGRLTTTKPWYRTGFVFVGRQADGAPPASFDDERLSGMTVGVPVTGLGDGTPPMIALAKRGRIDTMRSFSVYDPASLMDAVARGEVDTGVLWGPFAGWLAADREVPLVLARAPARDGMTPFAFDISIGLKKGNDTLRAELDRALEHRSAEIEAALARWHIPHGQDW